MYVRPPPGRGDFSFGDFSHAPLPKTCPKTVFPRKGLAFLWKAFLQKNFQVREKIPLAQGLALPLRATRRTGSSQGPGGLA